MHIHRFPLGKLKTNSYVVTDDETFCIVVDPGEQPHELIDFIQNRKIDAILLTHAHHDHIAGLNELMEYTDALVFVHQLEADWLIDPELNQSSRTSTPIIYREPDVLLNGNEAIQFGTLNIKAIHTPGHSPGSTSFLFNEKYIFTGDTLLAGLVGPTNLAFGDRNLLKHSIQSKLFTLPDEIRIYPGHGETSTIGVEKEHNLFPNIKTFF